MGDYERFNEYQYGLSRRRFLQLTAMSALAVATGCATDPVTGRRQLMLVSEQDEIQIDRRYAPIQFSTDYGPTQDHALNAYVNEIGRSLALETHRPHMPYSFRVVNANYVNAYAFPGGSIACTRGILLMLENEAELAGLLGHEIGHVNARHTAEQMSKSQVSSIVVSGLAVLADRAAGMGQVASALGGIGAGVFLARYSRDNEREADALGMRYMAGSGYNAEGMVGLMDMLNKKKKTRPSAIELMFATHPMSEERYRNAVHSATTTYASSKNLSLNRERYMDNTAKLRSIKGAIEEMQKGDEAMGSKNYRQAEKHYRIALKRAPYDYAALLSMAKCQLIQRNYAEGARYAEQAKSSYPREAQGHHLHGFAALKLKNFESAYQNFQNERRLLPENPTSIFFMGYSLEEMGRRQAAARQYQRYLQRVRQGDYAQHAARQLQKWGYVL